MRKLVIARLIPEMVGAAIRSFRRPVGAPPSGRRTPLVYGGVYIWQDAAAMQAYLPSDLGKGVTGNPSFANPTSSGFEILSGPTTSSGGPVAASLTATASLAS